MDREQFIAGYITAALWSSTDSNGVPLDQNFTSDAMAPETRRRIEDDCDKFLSQNSASLNISNCAAYRAGVLFWWNRNGHGSGFWDEKNIRGGAALDRASRAVGECNLDVGDDCKIYIG